MSGEIHARAEQLILEARVGTMPEQDGIWLDEHLRTCPGCCARAEAVDDAIRSLRSISVELDSALVEITRLRVRQRSVEMRAQRLPRIGLWLGCALSWLWISQSAPGLWRGFAWAATKTGMPSPFWQMAFALWWAVPALVAAVALSYRSLQGADSTANG
jgi:anti-sigma factor RsiW